jgi:hypothetical protein
MQYEKRGNTLVLKRNMQLNVYRFPVQSYPGLKRWFGDIAAADEKPVVVQLQ